MATPVNQQLKPEREQVSGMTYEEFLEWADEDTHAEWVGGNVIMSSPVSSTHQKVSLFLLQLISLYVQIRNSGQIRFENFQMKTGPDLPGREPDILFVATEHLGRMRENFLDGPADLVVEIVSPDSIGRDRGEKFQEYEQGGVREYWIIDPKRHRAEFYRLDSEGVYRPVEPDASGAYHSGVLDGLSFPVDVLWQDPLPPVTDYLAAWTGR